MIPVSTEEFSFILTLGVERLRSVPRSGILFTNSDLNWRYQANVRFQYRLISNRALAICHEMTATSKKRAL